VTGTIPDGLRNMQNLTLLNIGNNWFNGTVPNWVADLQFLRVLNLGSQFGNNEGTDRTGFLGTIPARIGELHLLKELILHSNSLEGQLPPNLCHKGKAS
jgi:hypothetical protein